MVTCLDNYICMPSFACTEMYETERENFMFCVRHYLLQIATFCGQQGRISRTVRAILSGQFEGTAGLGYPGPANQY